MMLRLFLLLCFVVLLLQPVLHQRYGRKHAHSGCTSVTVRSMTWQTVANSCAWHAVSTGDRDRIVLQMDDTSDSRCCREVRALCDMQRSGAIGPMVAEPIFVRVTGRGWEDACIDDATTKPALL